MTYSLDMRKQVLKIRNKEGLSMSEVAKRFGVGVASVMRWSKNIECVKKRNRSSKIDLESLKLDVERYPDAYQYERATRLGVSEYSVWYALKSLNVTYKKTLQHPKATPEKRFAYCEELNKHKEKDTVLTVNSFFNNFFCYCYQQQGKSQAGQDSLRLKLSQTWRLAFYYLLQQQKIFILWLQMVFDSSTLHK